MKRTIIAVILALGLLLMPATASAAGVTVVDKTGDGVWIDNTWEVEMFPGETKSTVLTFYNSSSSVLDVEVTVMPDSLDGGNLTFELDKTSFTMAGKSSTNVTLTVEASGSATPGTYTTELEIKSEVPPVYRPPAGGGGGFFPDRIAPTMSNISAFNIGETSADIRWRTNERSTSQVECWSSLGILSPLDETMCLDHLVHLTGLTLNTTYHYKALSRDMANNLAISKVHSFTTLGEVTVAIFTSSDLSISPSEVDVGEAVTITALIFNSGNAVGSYGVMLKINGVAEAIKKVTIDAGDSKGVTFATARDVSGSYSVAVNGLSGSFTVREEVVPAPAPPPVPPPPVPDKPIPWGWIVGITVGLVLVVGGIAYWRQRARAG